MQQLKRGIPGRAFRQRPANGNRRARRHPGIAVGAVHQVEVSGLILDLFIHGVPQDLLCLVNQQIGIGVRVLRRFENAVKQQGDLVAFLHLDMGAIDGIERLGQDDCTGIPLTDLRQRISRRIPRLSLVQDDDLPVLLGIRRGRGPAHRQRTGVGSDGILPTLIGYGNFAFLNSAAVDLHFQL